MPVRRPAEAAHLLRVGTAGSQRVDRADTLDSPAARHLGKAGTVPDWAGTVPRWTDIPGKTVNIQILQVTSQLIHFSAGNIMKFE